VEVKAGVYLKGMDKVSRMSIDIDRRALCMAEGTAETSGKAG
jgi:hypothetical protein